MRLELVLNERSLPQPAPDTATARRLMSGLVSTIQHLGKVAPDLLLRTRDPFFATELGKGYTGRHWAYDSVVPQDERLLIITFATQTPFFSDADGADIRDQSLTSEFEYAGRPAEGLGCAYLLQGIGLSLASAADWTPPWVTVNHHEVDETTEQVVITPVQVRHASCPPHVATHEDWLRGRLATGVRNGRDLWRRRSDLFPNLKFCDDVEGQLRRLYSGALLQATLDRLTELDKYSRDWTAGPFQRERILSKVSPESVSTMQQYSQERTHECPYGRELVFEWHVRLTPLAWRVYFYPDEVRKEIIIGHIGPKPPTVSDPT